MVRTAFATIRTLTGLFATLCTMVLLMGCASSRPPSSAPPPSLDAAAAEQRLRATVDNWYGTPYAYGGESSNGIDCSAFVQMLYRDVLGVAVPRTTTRQSQAGRSVAVREAQTGDLVFFRPDRKQRHVGIYLGDGEFAHASTSQGVMVSDLSESYWQQIYWMTRRLLPDAWGAGASKSGGSGTSTQPRTGW